MPFSAWKKTCTAGGTKLATRVGSPMPRFTTMPSRSSRATRRAMSSRLNPAGSRSAIPANRQRLALDDPVDVDRRRPDPFRVERSRLDDVFDLGDHHLGSHGHDGVEVA